MFPDLVDRARPAAGPDRLQCVRPPTSERPRVRLAVRRCVEDDNAKTVGPQRHGEGSELCTEAAPAVHQMDNRSGAETDAADRGVLCRHDERSAAVGHRSHPGSWPHLEPSGGGDPRAPARSNQPRVAEARANRQRTSTNERAFLERTR